MERRKNTPLEQDVATDCCFTEPQTGMVTTTPLDWSAMVESNVATGSNNKNKGSTEKRGWIAMESSQLQTPFLLSLHGSCAPSKEEQHQPATARMTTTTTNTRYDSYGYYYCPTGDCCHSHSRKLLPTCTKKSHPEAHKQEPQHTCVEPESHFHGPGQGPRPRMC